jgi:hypothetical protein
MPSSTIFHAVFFAAGAAIGATAVTLAGGRKERLRPVSSKPIVEVGPNGVPTLTKQGMDAGDVLKYGNPGKDVIWLSIRTDFLVRCRTYLRLDFQEGLYAWL